MAQARILVNASSDSRVSNELHTGRPPCHGVATEAAVPQRDGVPGRGAFVFYDCLCPSENGPVNWGHCGIGLGDGPVIHAWDKVRIDCYLDIEKLTALTGDHPKYLGWVPLEHVIDQKP